MSEACYLCGQPLRLWPYDTIAAERGAGYHDRCLNLKDEPRLRAELAAERAAHDASVAELQWHYDMRRAAYESMATAYKLACTRANAAEAQLAAARADGARSLLELLSEPMGEDTAEYWKAHWLAAWQAAQTEN